MFDHEILAPWKTPGNSIRDWFDIELDLTDIRNKISSGSLRSSIEDHYARGGVIRLITSGYQPFQVTWMIGDQIGRFDDGPAFQKMNTKDGSSPEAKWFQDGVLHRDNDLPAWTSTWSSKYYQNGVLHRDNDLPAVEFDNKGNGIWYQFGKMHRADEKPAYLYGDQMEWALEGKPYARPNDAPNRVLGKMLIWLDSEGQFHRDGNPAVVYPKGKVEWYQFGKKHREDGPAVVLTDGREKFYLDDRFVRADRFPGKVAALQAERNKEDLETKPSDEPVKVGFIG